MQVGNELGNGKNSSLCGTKNLGGGALSPSWAFPRFPSVLPCGCGWCRKLHTLLCPVLLCPRGSRTQSPGSPGEVVAVGVPCFSGSPPPV